MHCCGDFITRDVNSFHDSASGNSAIRDYWTSISSYHDLYQYYSDGDSVLGYQSFNNFTTNNCLSSNNANSYPTDRNNDTGDKVNNGVYNPVSSDHLRWKATKIVCAKRVKVGTKPVYCAVCNCHCNSSVQARHHFNGQSHQKKAFVVKREDKISDSRDLHDGVSVSGGPANDVISVVEKGNGASNPEQPVDNDISLNSEVSLLTETKNVTCKDEVDHPPSKKKKVAHTISCEFCNATFNSQVQADDHFRGMKHFKKLRLLQKSLLKTNSHQGDLTVPSPSRKCHFQCHLCNVSLNSSLQFDQHCTGQAHKKKLLSSSTPENEVEGNKGGWFYCMACNISCRTSLGLQRHVTSKEHKAVASQRRGARNLDSKFNRNDALCLDAPVWSR